MKYMSLGDERVTIRHDKRNAIDDDVPESERVTIRHDKLHAIHVPGGERVKARHNVVSIFIILHESYQSITCTCLF